MTRSVPEKLRLAAKAAGFLFDPTQSYPTGLMVVPPEARYQTDQLWWNPLDNAEQAFELAARLNLVVQFDQHYVSVCWKNGGDALVRGFNASKGPDFKLKAAQGLILQAAITIQVEKENSEHGA